MSHHSPPELYADHSPMAAGYYGSFAEPAPRSSSQDQMDLQHYAGASPPLVGSGSPQPSLSPLYSAHSTQQRPEHYLSPAHHAPAPSFPSSHSTSSYTYSSTPALSTADTESTSMSTSSSPQDFPLPPSHLPSVLYPAPTSPSSGPYSSTSPSGGPYYHSTSPNPNTGGNARMVAHGGAGGGGSRVYISPPGAGEGPVRGSGGDEGKAPEGKRSASGVLNGELVVATRKGEDLGVDLGDFDMLDTLGTGTFGKVLLARLRSSMSRPGQGQPHYFAMKVLEKVTVVRLRQVEHLNSERSTLAHVSHPFIVNLFCTFQDERNLYLLLEYVQGGELFSHLRRAGRFSSDVARFYLANLILALEYLHSQDIIYRDLKPENLLIDPTGYLKITDFGFAKYVTERTYTLCGTPEYLAPEIILATGHGKAADWYALGVLMFELLAGYPPFFADNPLEIYEKILAGKFGFPPHIDFVAKDLIKRLLTADITKRLGNLKAGASDIKNHRWFEGVDWEAVARKEIRAPIVPQTATPGDTTNFERYPVSPLEDLPGPLRAHRARLYQISPDDLEYGPDPYGYLFPAF